MSDAVRRWVRLVAEGREQVDDLQEAERKIRCKLKCRYIDGLSFQTRTGI